MAHAFPRGTILPLLETNILIRFASRLGLIHDNSGRAGYARGMGSLRSNPLT